MSFCTKRWSRTANFARTGSSSDSAARQRGNVHIAQYGRDGGRQRAAERLWLNVNVAVSIVGSRIIKFALISKPWQTPPEQPFPSALISQTLMLAIKSFSTPELLGNERNADQDRRQTNNSQHGDPEMARHKYATITVSAPGGNLGELF